MEILKPRPKNIKENHFQELKASGIIHEIIELNFKSLEGNVPYEYLCYGVNKSERTNTGRLPERYLRRYSHTESGGWYCAGINLIDYSESQWGCFKPDNPRKVDNKFIKYEHPCNVPTEIFALKVSDAFWKDLIIHYQVPKKKESSFWEWVVNNPLPVIVTEGGKKTASLLSQKLISLGVSGIWNTFRDEELHPQLKKLCRAGREIIFAFDQDTKWTTKRDVVKAIKKTGRAFEELGCQVSVMVWDNKDGKGIDDFIVKTGMEKLQEVYAKRLSLEDYLEKHEKVKTLNKPDFLKFLLTDYKERLAFNELTSQVELDGKPIDLTGELCFKLIEESSVDVSSETLINGFLYQAKKNSYHPVAKYLQICSVLPANIVRIDNLANRYLGIKKDDPLSDLYNTFVRKWLIAAVARIFEPGCKVDYALILQGRKHGTGKSTFFKVLGGEWHDSSATSDIESNKNKLVFHSCWIQEWDEFEKVTSMKGANELKSFITNPIDAFVRPYGRESLRYPRRFILAGTVNNAEFLRDETGDRRFLVIPLSDIWELNKAKLEEERDYIMSAAYHAYHEGKKAKLKDPSLKDPWVITPEEDILSHENNKRFQVTDEWEFLIEDFIQPRKEVTISFILEKLFFLEVDKHDRQSQMRVAKILTKLGWINTGIKTDPDTKQRKKVWSAPNT